MSLIRLLLWGLLFYLLVKILRRVFSTRRPSQRVERRNSPKNVSPPPYDPKNVEDIDYQEVKRKPKEE